jgi:hypothetical protein
VFPELIVAVVVVAANRGLFQGPVHSLDPCFRCGTSVEKADRIRLELLLRLFVACHFRQPADLVPLIKAMQ